METVAFCEIEEFPRKVLAKHWPNIPIYEDVKNVTKERLDADGINDIGLVCGGYPCQPFSVAGKRGGKTDDRHLWPEMFRIIKDVKPRWVIAENVTGHISMGIDEVLFDLEAINYEWQTIIIPACAVYAGHRRDRLWIVANPHKKRCKGSAKKQVEQKPFKPREFVRSFTQWPRRSSLPASRFCRASDGVSGRVDRLECLGNAVVPQTPELIGRAIMQIEKGK